MPQDVRDLTDFYKTPLGQLAGRTIAREIHNLWPDLRNYRVLGYGFAIPYLRAFTGNFIFSIPQPERGIYLSLPYDEQWRERKILYCCGL